MSSPHASAEPSGGPAGKPGRTAGPPKDVSIAGLIGAELSTPLHALLRLIQSVGDDNRLTADERRQFAEALVTADRIVRQSQQLARLAEGRVRQSHERVSLDRVLDAALNERRDALRASGVALSETIEAVEIVVDPGLLSSLVETAIDWAALGVQALEVQLGVNSWPEHGLLTLQTVRAAESKAPGHAEGSLHWQLLEQIARTMGVTLSIRTIEHSTTLQMEFARTVKHLEGLTSMEIESNSGDSALHAETKALAGLHVLLVSNDPAVCADVEKACRGLGLRPDVVANSAQAIRATERDQPHMIIIDQRLRDTDLDALMQDIRRVDPRLGLLEITGGVNQFEVSSWTGASLTRLSRDMLRSRLPTALTLELAKAI